MLASPTRQAVSPIPCPCHGHEIGSPWLLFLVESVISRRFIIVRTHGCGINLQYNHEVDLVHGFHEAEGRVESLCQNIWAIYGSCIPESRRSVFIQQPPCLDWSRAHLLTLQYPTIFISPKMECLHTKIKRYVSSTTNSAEPVITDHQN